MEYTLEHFEVETSIDTYLEGFVDVAEFLEFCKACPNYDKVWSCPPYDFDPYDIWKTYENILVYGYKINYEGERTEEAMTKVLWDVKRRVSEELFQKEEEIPGSQSLSAGTCQVCESCTKPEGAPCRHPNTMRYSIESLGGNVGKTISKLCGIEIQWVEEGKLPDYFVLVGGLLKK